MQTNYFTNCNTVEDTKKLYKELAMKHHPDLGGSTVTMQEINAQYDTKLKQLDGQTSTDSSGNTHKYKYSAETEYVSMEIIDKLLSLKMVNVEIFLVGTWIWIEGETKPYKEELKALKCRWHSTRKLWYFTSSNKNKHYRKSGNGIDDIAKAYGATKIKDKDKTKSKSKKVLANCG